MTHLSDTHPHRLSALDRNPMRDRFVARAAEAVRLLEGERREVALRILGVLELLAGDDIVGALEHLEQACDDVRELRDE